HEVFEDFSERLIDRTEHLKVGDPRKRDTFYGPLIDERAGKTYVDAVNQAQQDGGSLLAGGEVLTGGLFDRGCYVRPTIVSGLPHVHRLVKEELFVPFLVLDACSSLEEAVSNSNSTNFGLTAGIFSEDEGEITYFFEHIAFGTCYANRGGGATTGAWPGAQPFTGWKASGATGKGVGGPYYLLSFMREQAQTRAK
ncbi:MAG TPA: aldehyde dehydrogenase family protein, partial [Methanomicrobiales archaeon]|nr:aldehyde dehydrogenase family protein [Methanomicrobiales archaeon]